MESVPILLPCLVRQALAGRAGGASDGYGLGRGAAGPDSHHALYFSSNFLTRQGQSIGRDSKQLLQRGRRVRPGARSPGCTQRSARRLLQRGQEAPDCAAAARAPLCCVGKLEVQPSSGSCVDCDQGQGLCSSARRGRRDSVRRAVRHRASRSRRATPLSDLSVGQRSSRAFVNWRACSRVCHRMRSTPPLCN